MADDETVVVLETTDQTEILMAKSVLESAGIPHLVQGEGIRNLFGFGGLTPVNPVSGPILLKVSAEQAEEARQLLAAAPEDEE